MIARGASTLGFLFFKILLNRLEGARLNDGWRVGIDVFRIAFAFARPRLDCVETPAAAINRVGNELVHSAEPPITHHGACGNLFH